MSRLLTASCVNAVDLERGRVRPFVIFDIILRPPFVLVSLKNIGQTPAFNVQVTASPSIEVLLGGENVYPSEERAIPMAFIARPVAMLAPQREISSVMGTRKRVKAAHPTLRFEGTVSYRDAGGDPYSEEPFTIDLSI